MDIVPIVIIALIIVTTLWWVLKPLWDKAEQTTVNVPLQQQTLAELEQRRDSAYTAIKDLEMDFETGKIAQQDYQRVRMQLTQQAAVILKQIDRLSESVDIGLDEEIDSLLAQYRLTSDEALIEQVRTQIEREVAQKADFTCPNCYHPATAEDSFCSQCGTVLTNLCPTCRKATAPGDSFCTHCGARLVAEVTE